MQEETNWKEDFDNSCKKGVFNMDLDEDESGEFFYDEEKIKHFIEVVIHEELIKYTNWLVKHNYTDSDVYAGEPTAVDEFLKL